MPANQGNITEIPKNSPYKTNQTELIYIITVSGIVSMRAV
jgi:hypothetical protein